VIVGDLVSIIMPAYNADRYVADSIRSVCAQTLTSWELVIVDDGSTDKTADVVRELASGEPRIKYVFQENGRLGKARNTGVLNSSGRLIAFLDSDDLWLPEKLELQVRAQEATAADLVYTGAYIFRGDDVADETRAFAILHGKFAGDEMLDLLLECNRIPVMSVLIKRDAFDEAGPFEEAAPYHGCEDYDLWLKLAKHDAVFYGMEEKLVRYRRHPSAMTYKDSNVLKPMLRVVSRHIDASTLNEDKKRSRLRRLYRDLIAALLDEGELAEAQEFLREFSAWDKSGVVTSLQKLLMKVSPRNFNVISRECLYRAEWHLSKLTRRLPNNSYGHNENQT
jgi:teichuronic acid biosynthesis glycosyltransferase TuaG